MFIVQKLVFCTNDGTGESDIIGIFNSKEKAQQILKNEVLKEFEFCGVELFNECDMTGTQDILDALEEKFEGLNKRLYVVTDEDYGFVAGHRECWHEYYIALTIEEKEFND